MCYDLPTELQITSLITLLSSEEKKARQCAAHELVGVMESNRKDSEKNGNVEMDPGGQKDKEIRDGVVHQVVDDPVLTDVAAEVVRGAPETGDRRADETDDN